MITLDIELLSLKENLIELLEETINQLIKCKKAFPEGDVGLAKEILDAEKRVNSLELMIDKECESILALNQPVATDLRFVITALKISNDLERIGDNAKQIAKYILAEKGAFSESLIKEFELPKMFNLAIEMLEEMGKALKKGDSKLAKKILSKDDELDKIHDKSPDIASELLKENTKKAKEIINLYTIVGKLERVGDLTKNIGEEVIFHVDAKVIKHKKLKKDKK